MPDTTVANATTSSANAEVETEITDTTTVETATTNVAGGVNERLLLESKKYKERAMKAEKDLEALNKAEQTKQGQFKEMYEKAEEKYQTLYKTFVKEKVKSSVATAASKMGLVDVDAALLLGNRELLQFDEESGDVLGADLFLEDLKKQRAFLFSQAKAPVINPATPGGKPQAVTPVTKDNLAGLTSEKRKELFADAWSKFKKD